MKNRDKILDYFDNVADGTIVSANDMYEHGFERMNQEAFFRAVERLSDEGEICILRNQTHREILQSFY